MDNQIVTAYNNSLENLQILRRLVFINNKSITENVSLLKRQLSIYYVHVHMLQVLLKKNSVIIKYNINDHILYIPEKEHCCFPKRTPFHRILTYENFNSLIDIQKTETYNTIKFLEKPELYSHTLPRAKN